MSEDGGMSREESEGLAREFMASVVAVLRGMRAVFRGEMESTGVTWPQFHLMRHVMERGDVTVTKLSQELMVAAPTASRMIDGLSGRNLLEKGKDPVDRRLARVRLTVEGERLLEGLMASQAVTVSELLEGEDEREVKRLVSGLRVLAERWSGLAEAKNRRREGERG